MSDSTLCHSNTVEQSAARRLPPNAGKGRKKGVPNKTTASVQAALTEAFERRGGVDALIKWAEDDPTEFYKLWGKLIPKDIKAELSGNVGIVHQWRFGDKVIQF